MIVIVDYGMGNLESVARAFRRVKAEVKVSSRPEDAAAADKIVLPGVGAFGQGMANLRAGGFIEVLTRRVIDEGVPLLGICLGFQVLTKRSDEGSAEGLGWIDGETRRFEVAPKKVPHIGWNDLTVRKPSDPLLAGLPGSPCFYFQHSYHVTCHDPSDVLATADYGGEIVAAIRRGNIAGTQFHPEKSTANGLQLVRNFVEGR
jgi:glutamine amidotransferase